MPDRIWLDCPVCQEAGTIYCTYDRLLYHKGHGITLTTRCACLLTDAQKEALYIAASFAMSETAGEEKKEKKTGK